MGIAERNSDALIPSFPNSIWERDCLRNSIAPWFEKKRSAVELPQQVRSQTEFGNEGNRQFSSQVALKMSVCLIVITLLSGCGPTAAERELEVKSIAKENHILATIKIGMTKKEVIEKMGPPSMDDSGADKFPMLFYIEPMDPLVRERGGFGGFSVSLADGKVTRVDIIKQDVDPIP